MAALEEKLNTLSAVKERTHKVNVSKAPFTKMTEEIKFAYFTEPGVLNPEEEIYCIGYRAESSIVTFGEVAYVLTKFLETHPEFKVVQMHTKMNPHLSRYDIVFEVHPDGKVYMVHR